MDSLFKINKNTKRRSSGILPSWLGKPLRFFIRSSFIMLVLAIIIAVYYMYLANQYDLDEVAKMPTRTQVLDKNGKEYATLFGKRRRLISYEEIPKHLIAALYAREDADFESHYGVKVTGLIRATLRNLKDKKFTQGGSTLTMQLVKNTYDNRAKTIHRKLLEIALTLKVEARYEKKEIITHYLNRIYFGAGAYGIEEAALTYFGKNAKELSLGESALLVGIIRGPHIFSPFNNPDAALQQRDQVLKRMLDINAITAKQEEIYKNQPLTFAKKDKRKRYNSYTLQTLERHLKVILEVEELEQEGLIIHTSIDPKIVNIVDNAHKKLNHKGKQSLQTAAVVLDSKTGAIRAINGGFDVKKSPYNIALDSKRTLRSAFTPFLEITALDNGYTAIKGRPVLSGRQIGIKKVIQFAKKIGIDSAFPQTEDLYRGFVQSTPLQLATALTLFANDGEIPHTYIITKIKNKKGEILYEHPEKRKRIVTKGYAEEVAKLHPSPKGSYFQHLALDKSMRDAWLLSVQPDYTIAFWCGHSKGEKINAPYAKLKEELQQLLRAFLSFNKKP